MSEPQAPKDLAQLATSLLMAIVRGETWAVAHYDGLLFPILKEVALRRGAMLATDAAQRMGDSGVSTPTVRPSDLEELAVVAAQRALVRARASALRFDPDRGDGASWALGALGYAYLDAARELSRSRRIAVEVPSEDLTLHGRSQLEANDPVVQVEARDALRRALESLTEDERYVVLATLQYGFTYRETAELRFGDATSTKRVDRLLQTARAKLREAYEAWIHGT